MDLDALERRVGQALATVKTLAGDVEGLKSRLDQGLATSGDRVGPLMERLEPVLAQIGPLLATLPRCDAIEAEFAKIGPLLEEIRGFKERFEPLLSALAQMHPAGQAAAVAPIVPGEPQQQG